MDIHMNDYFWLNSGDSADGGFGVEGMPVAGGQLSFASFRFKDVANSNSGTNFDLRLEGIKVSDKSNMNFWLYAAMKHKNMNDESDTGFGVGGWLTTEDVMGGSNTITVLYRDGAATNGTVVLDDTANFDELNRFEINNNLVIEPNQNYSLQWGTVYRVEERAANNGKVTWMSTGIRPIVYLTDHLNVAFELGYDNLHNEVTGQDGSLTKATIALQLAKSRGYYSRPVLRAFVTAAEWDDDFQGEVGGVTYAGDTSGWAAGVQLESWW